MPFDALDVPDGMATRDVRGSYSAIADGRPSQMFLMISARRDDAARRTSDRRDHPATRSGVRASRVRQSE